MDDWDLFEDEEPKVSGSSMYEELDEPVEPKKRKEDKMARYKQKAFEEFKEVMDNLDPDEKISAPDIRSRMDIHGEKISVSTIQEWMRKDYPQHVFARGVNKFTKKTMPKIKHKETEEVPEGLTVKKDRPSKTRIPKETSSDGLRKQITEITIKVNGNAMKVLQELEKLDFEEINIRRI